MPHSLEDSYKPSIDGLRAISILAVWLYHFDRLALPGGYLGVDIFFVISGYVISSSMYSRDDASFREFILGFYARRIRRLMPSLFVSIIAAAILVSLFNPQPLASLTTGLWATFGFSNYQLYSEGIKYASEASDLNVFTHTWSLGVEEQFYLILPTLFWVTKFRKSNKRVLEVRLLMLMIILGSVYSLGQFIIAMDASATDLHYLLEYRFWELGAGCLAFIASSKHSLRTSGVVRAIAAIPLLAILAMFFLADNPLWSIAAVASTVLLLLLIETQSFPVQKVMESSWMTTIGRWSYSLYLWHWIVICIGRWTIGSTWEVFPFQTALIFLLAGLSYNFVEQPIRRANWTKSSGRTIAAGIFSMIALACALKLWSSNSDSPLYLGEKPSLIAKGVISLSSPYHIPYSGYSWAGASCVLQDVNDTAKIPSPDSCTLGNWRTAKKRILIFGNSFSSAFVGAFDSLVVADSVSVTVTSCWGGSPIPGVERSGELQLRNRFYWSQVLDSMSGILKKGDEVFMISELAEYSPMSRNEESDSQLSAYTMAVRRYSNELASRGVRLSVLSGLPFAREAKCKPSQAMDQWFTFSNTQCTLPDRQETMRRQSVLRDSLRSLQKQGHINVIDLMGIFCPNAECTYFAQDGTMLYRDEYSHPSIEATRLASRILRNQLLKKEEPAAWVRRP